MQSISWCASIEIITTPRTQVLRHRCLTCGCVCLRLLVALADLLGLRDVRPPEQRLVQTHDDYNIRLDGGLLCGAREASDRAPR